MTAARIFKPENRLRRIIGNPGDPTAEVLAAAADRNVGSLNESIRAHVAEKLQVIHALASKPEETVRANSKALGDAALAVCETAAAAGMTTVGEAARGVKVMVDALDHQGIWHIAALNLHVNALTFFSTNPESEKEKKNKMLSELKSMREKIGITN